MAEGLAPGAEMSDQMVTHFDRCLGCMACVTACPSGVQYDRLIERVRPQVERNHRRGPAERALRRLLYETLPHPRRLRALVPLLQSARKLGAERLPDRLAMMAKVAPRTTVAQSRIRIPKHTPAAGVSRGRVGLLQGCVQRVFYPHVHQATVAVLAAEGFEVLAPRAARLLRCARAARGRRAGRARAGATDDRGVRAGGRRHRPGSHHRQRGRLRLGDEGLRRPARHARGEGVLGTGARRLGAAGLRRAARAPRTGPAARRLPRRLSPGPRSGRPLTAAGAAGGDPGARPGGGRRRARRCAAARRGSTTSSSPRPRRSSARARRDT